MECPFFCIGTITNILHSGFQSQPFGDITLKVKIQIITIVSNPRHEIIIKYIAHTAKETYFLTASAKVQRMLGSQHMFVQYQISPIRIWIVIGIAAISKPSDFFIRISLIFPPEGLALYLAHLIRSHNPMNQGHPVNKSEF